MLETPITRECLLGASVRCKVPVGSAGCTLHPAAASWELSQGLVPAAAAVQSRTKIQVTCLLGSSSTIPPPAAATRPAELHPRRGFHQRLSLKRWKLFLVPSSIHHRAEMRAADYGGNGDPDRSDTNSKYFYTIAQIF